MTFNEKDLLEKIVRRLRFWFMTAIVLVLILCLAAVVKAAPEQQALTSPTPDYDGNILYTVSEMDTCLSISLKMGVDIETLRTLNNLDVNCTLIAGTRILLGRVLTATPTAGPSPTPTLVLPTPTPYNGSAELCIYLFEDINGNAKAEETERGIAGGAVSVTKRGGTENFTGLTTGVDLLCFPEVPEGDYNISIAPPNEFNPTTNMNYALKVQAGDTTQVNFGAQKQAAFEDAVVVQTQQTRKSPLLAIAGMGLIGVGIVIVVIFGILRRRD